MTTLKIGDVLLAYFSKHVEVFGQDSEDDTTLIYKLNQMSPIECRANIKTIIATIRTLPEYEEYPKYISDDVLRAFILKAVRTVLKQANSKAKLEVSKKHVGNNLYVLASKYLIISVDTKCCSLRKTLNIYGPGLTNNVIAMLIGVVRNSKEYKSLGFQLHNRFIYLLLRKAIRMTGVDMGKLRRYSTKHFPKRRQTNAVKKR